MSALGRDTVFNPTVAMAMGSTARTTLKGVNDKIRSMSGGMTSSSRTYYLFNDGSAGSTVKLFIATADDSMMMKFPAVSVGSTLHDMNNAAVPVSSMKVEVSTDKASWSSATDNGNGHWSAAGLIGLGATGHAYVRVTVNGEQKTTDGTALSASNGYADFTVSTSGGM